MGYLQVCESRESFVKVFVKRISVESHCTAYKRAVAARFEIM